mmetsp:Transcript_69917/g.116115  ORF Transcript_69917/g.116115 Transcript_69917/m.116115 type:complete len:155 (-) Transcript_69917:473-937(-)
MSTSFDSYSTLKEAAPTAGSICGGVLFGIGWLLWIDGVVTASTDYGMSISFGFWLPGLLQTMALFMVNVINWSLLSGDDPLDEGIGAKVKCWVFFSFVLAFTGLISSSWILIAAAQSPSSDEASFGPALRVMLQNLFVFAGSLLFRIMRTTEDS